MLDARSQRRTGIALVAAAAIALSTVPFFTRLLHFDSWTILFRREPPGAGSTTVLPSSVRNFAATWLCNSFILASGGGHVLTLQKLKALARGDDQNSCLSYRICSDLLQGHLHE